MKLAISIPTYNRKDSLTTLLESVFKETENLPTDVQIEVWIFDNCSTDDTEDFVKSNFAGHNIKYLRNEMNYGFLVNITRAIFVPVSDYLLLLPDDSILEKGALKRVTDMLRAQQPDLLILNRYDNCDDKTYSDVFDFFEEHFNTITWMGGYVYSKKAFSNRNFFEVSKTWFPHVEYVFNNRENITKIIYLKNDVARKNEGIADTYLRLDHLYNILVYLDYIYYRYGIKITMNSYKKFLDWIEEQLVLSATDRSFYIENQNRIDRMIEKYLIYSFSSYRRILGVIWKPRIKDWLSSKMPRL
jgi:glycosyltransferase involved in cell wall biosynthesis